jgi:dTDP-4-dehydrorhamnose 3,5-epimerase-like enzyme
MMKNNITFECDVTGVQILRPQCNLDTVRDGRGCITTYLPEDAIHEFNIVFFHAGMVRGMHYHQHFVEYSLCVQGEGVFVYQLDPNDEKSEVSLPLSKGICIRIPKGVVHTIYSVTELTMVASLSKRWDDSKPPIIQVRETPKPTSLK